MKKRNVSIPFELAQALHESVTSTDRNDKKRRGDLARAALKCLEEQIALQHEPTPGPWEKRGNRIVGNKNTRDICLVISEDDPEGSANARLIKSAPALLQWAKNVLEQEGDKSNLQKIVDGIYCEADQEPASDPEKKA